MNGLSIRRMTLRGEHEPWAWGKQSKRDVSNEMIEGKAHKVCPVSSIYITASSELVFLIVL